MARRAPASETPPPAPAGGKSGHALRPIPAALAELTAAGRLPRHVALIMDGNGRWAQSRGLKRIEGHRAGAESVRDIVTRARELEIEYLTLYAFSSENWNRPGDEVTGLMSLLVHHLDAERELMRKNEIALHAIGDIGRLPITVRTLLKAVMRATAKHKQMRLTLALSYGGRDEILRAARKAMADAIAGKLAPRDLTAGEFAARLDTHDMPDPDVIIRTSGEKRLSNFLLWQAAYTEIIITDTYWPDFRMSQFDATLIEFGSRQRRFGLTGEQVRQTTAAT